MVGGYIHEFNVEFSALLLTWQWEGERHLQGLEELEHKHYFTFFGQG